mmetsp:Transcript_19345/g.68417  ORF Transcript_19345/g.68417 Transcript_19345/m.68417 type:complete len:558 (+) Transcript_19345:542-2215(+)
MKQRCSTGSSGRSTATGAASSRARLAAHVHPDSQRRRRRERAPASDSAQNRTLNGVGIHARHAVGTEPDHTAPTLARSASRKGRARRVVGQLGDRLGDLAHLLLERLFLLALPLRRLRALVVVPIEQPGKRVDGLHGRLAPVVQHVALPGNKRAVEHVVPGRQRDLDLDDEVVRSRAHDRHERQRHHAAHHSRLDLVAQHAVESQTGLVAGFAVDVEAVDNAVIFDSAVQRAASRVQERDDVLDDVIKGKAALELVGQVLFEQHTLAEHIRKLRVDGGFVPGLDVVLGCFRGCRCGQCTAACAARSAADVPGNGGIAFTSAVTDVADGGARSRARPRANGAGSRLGSVGARFGDDAATSADSTNCRARNIRTRIGRRRSRWVVRDGAARWHRNVPMSSSTGAMFAVAVVAARFAWSDDAQSAEHSQLVLAVREAATRCKWARTRLRPVLADDRLVQMHLRALTPRRHSDAACRTTFRGRGISGRRRPDRPHPHAVSLRKVSTVVLDESRQRRLGRCIVSVLRRSRCRGAILVRNGGDPANGDAVLLRSQRTNDLQAQ